MRYLDPAIQLVLFIIGMVALACLFVGLSQFIPEFSTELKYLNIEIKRTDGEEQKYWKRRRRKLWLSLIPFVKY